MFEQKEFIRDGHATFIRCIVESIDEAGFEFEMCRYNKIQGMIPFQIVGENGKKYIQYNVSSLQSIEMFYKKKKLDLDQVILLLENLLEVYISCKVYLLDSHKVICKPEYVMYDNYQKKFLFFYSQSKMVKEEIEELAVFLIENIKYDDIVLVKIMHELYENIADSTIYVDPVKLVGYILEKLYIRRNDLQELLKDEGLFDIEEDTSNNNNSVGEIDPIRIYQEPDLEESELYMKHKKQIQLGIIVGFIGNGIIFALWKPYTLLKVFAFTAFFILFIGLFVQQKLNKRKMEEVKREEIYLKEYHEKAQYDEDGQNETRMLRFDEKEGLLHRISAEIQEDIRFGEGEYVVGYHKEHAHIVIPLEGISRVHAMITTQDGVHYIEDLNSKNGTWVNQSQLLPKEKRELKYGDVVRLAKYEYQFQ